MQLPTEGAHAKFPSPKKGVVFTIREQTFMEMSESSKEINFYTKQLLLLSHGRSDIVNKDRVPL